MKASSKLGILLNIWWWSLLDLPKKIKRIIWHKHILMWWHRLFIRQDEFHKSLNMNALAMLEMTPKEQENYLKDLCRRREIAHQRDLE